MATSKKSEALRDDEVVVHVPRGMGDKVKVVETGKTGWKSEIAVRVSRKRKPSTLPLLGVIVK